MFAFPPSSRAPDMFRCLSRAAYATAKWKPQLLAAISLLSLLSILRHLHNRYPQPKIDEPTPSEKLQFLAAGKSGVVYAIDGRRVLKEYHDRDEAEVECRAYDRLGSHPNIAKFLGTQPDGSIILERGELLRTLCQPRTAKETTLQTKLQWLLHAAKGYQHMHDLGIIHADVGLHNQILTSDGVVKIIDFEGCSIDGEQAGSCYEWSSYRPAEPRVSQATDIFAFGCAVYEVLTGSPPYHELRVSDDRYHQVEELYLQNKSALGSVDLTLSGATATSLLSKLGRTPSRRATEAASAAAANTATTGGTSATTTPTGPASATTATPTAATAALSASQPQRVYTPMTSVDNISGFFYDGPRHVSSSSKKSVDRDNNDGGGDSDLSPDRDKDAHSSHSCWFNTVHFSETDISRLPSYSPSRLSRRATNYMLLGMSIPALLDLYPLPHPSNQPAAKANLAAEYLRALLALLTEFEAFQQLHPTDGSTTSSLTRARIPHMFKRSVSGRPRKSSIAPVADIGAPLPQTSGLGSTLAADAPSQTASFDSNSSTYSTSSFASSASTLVAPAPQVAAAPSAGHATFPPPPPADAPNSLLLPNEGPYSHLLTPPLPFAPDFYVVFATLCDVLIDAYQRLQQLLCSPAICTPALSDSFSKVDARLRKVMVAGIVREFETASREAARREIVGLQRVVLGGLMG
ncbi:hypothetical protein DV735_g3395, partial [Chaetothyriales sp. CBS 134920]